MTSIITKFLGPTNTVGSRVAAQVSDYGSELERYSRAQGRPGRIIVDWNYGVNREENHKRAAMALAKRLGWADEWVGGEGPGGVGYVFVRRGSFCRFTVLNVPEEL